MTYATWYSDTSPARSMRCQTPRPSERMVKRVPELVNVPRGSLPGRRSDRAIAECEYARHFFRMTRLARMGRKTQRYERQERAQVLH